MVANCAGAMTQPLGWILHSQHTHHIMAVAPPALPPESGCKYDAGVCSYALLQPCGDDVCDVIVASHGSVLPDVGVVISMFPPVPPSTSLSGCCCNARSSSSSSSPAPLSLNHVCKLIFKSMEMLTNSNKQFHFFALILRKYLW